MMLLRLYRYLLQQRIITDTQFDKAEVYRTIIANSKLTDGIVNALRFLGLEPEMYWYHSTRYLTCTGTEELAQVDWRSMTGEDVSRMKGRLRESIVRTPSEIVAGVRTLHCENTGTFLDAPPYPIYPGVPVLDKSDGRYALNIPVDPDFEFDSVTDSIRFPRGIDILIGECDHGKYVRVYGEWTGPNPFVGILTTKAIQETAASIARIVREQRKAA